jgi:ParB-like nuclease domain
MPVMDIEIARIQVGARKRPVDDAIVREIAQSIERQGLLQPIGIKYTHDSAEDTYLLVFGAHRLAACALLEWEEIDARLLPSNLSDEEYQLIELQENSARNDLTKPQRKAYAAEVGQLITKLAEHSNVSIGNDQWLREMGKQSGIPQTTLYNWWNAFCAESGRKITPRQALDLDREDFFAWLQEQQAREEAEKARRQAEARATRQRQDFADALENLETLAADYGREMVITEVIDVFLASET